MDKAASRIRLLRCIAKVVLLPCKTTTFVTQNDSFCHAKGALLVENGAAATLKTDKTDSRKLYNRFFVCNDFLLHVRYLHHA